MPSSNSPCLTFDVYEQDVANTGIWYLCQVAGGIKDGINTKFFQVGILIGQSVHDTMLSVQADVMCKDASMSVLVLFVDLLF